MERPSGVFNTEYHAIGQFEDEDSDETDDNELTINEQDVLIHVNPENTKGNWNHIEDLDDFFMRVYNYHQRGGYLCMSLEDIFRVMRFIFVATFTYFMSHCVTYSVLFQTHYNASHKVTIGEAIIPADQCINGLGGSWYMVILTIIFVCVTVIRLVKLVINIVRYLYIRNFYVDALKISTGELANMTWHEVQGRLLEVQKEHQMCVHKRELTQLDIYHRILRFKNYMVAMVNVNLLPLKHNVPFLGEYAYLSMALKFNLELILFWRQGSGAPFENNWQLRKEYRSQRNKTEVIKKLENRIFWFGIANLVFSPLIFFWNIVYCFFRYAERFKTEPGNLGTRRWSNYSRLTLRHFNELDHEFNARLNKGYQPMSDYLNIFTSTISVIIAKNVAFFTGSIVAVMVALTVVDEDVLTVEHVLTVMSVLGLATTVCRALIPNEHLIHSPELLLRTVAMAIHYMPDKWVGNAHTSHIRDNFSSLFQLKIACILEEILSPIITPFILLFRVRPQAANIVDFLRMFTVEVVGVGDICSFAQMDVAKHGNVKWQGGGAQSSQAPPQKNYQAENGKTEMSLMHFHLTNPEWKPDAEGSQFINNLRSQVQRDMQTQSMMFTPEGHHSLISPSLHMPSLVPLQPVGPYTSMMSSLGGPMFTPTSGNQPYNLRLRGAVSQIEGPAVRPANTSLFGSMHSTLDSSGGLPEGTSLQSSISRQAIKQVDECTRELMTNEMNINALYMHELRWRRGNNDYLSQNDYMRAIWQSTEGGRGGGGGGGGSGSAHPHFGSMVQPAVHGASIMPEITEEGSADDEREVDTSVVSPTHRHTSSSVSPAHPGVSGAPHL